ncbi:Disintegrin and metalloproteinase domain-containing protein 28 [Hypsibius exemplaris]|uniref:Disintegrin and metalloproteinase domain-containing protein 28 n=1 Tax=Hypsibius exemplaris TaxID=2072580 RepID=A0A1W0X8H1_HYPEX|nr:Disintegrin and metalloproteinase domain-containing protein 28 [Hypsibius exemplaris]
MGHLTKGHIYTQKHVPQPSSAGGAINPANWSLKRDYERLLAANGWSAPQRAAVLSSTLHEIFYFDHSSSFRRGDVRRTSSVVPIPNQEANNVTSHFNNRSCPHNFTLSFTALGRKLNLFLTLNKYLQSPIFQEKIASRPGTEIDGSGKESDCFYQIKNYETFGTFSVDTNGYLRGEVQSDDTHLVIVPLLITLAMPLTDREGKLHVLTDSSHPQLLYVLGSSPVNTTTVHACGIHPSADGKKRRHNKEQKKRNGGRTHAHMRRSRSPSPPTTRDFRLQLKWIELGLIFDSSLLNLIKTVRQEPAAVALHLTNLIDQIYQPLKTRVLLSYLELWPDHNQIHITRDTSATLLHLMSYSTENLQAISFDSLQLVTASTKGFFADDFGTAATNSVCTLKSVGIVHNGPSLDLISLAVKVAHMLAHNLGIDHDTSTIKLRDCICPSAEGCLMEGHIPATSAWATSIFSSCSQDDYLEALHNGLGSCLLSSPFQDNSSSTTCGNGIVDLNEDCDCGGFTECLGKAPCCDPITCRFKDGAECAVGTCCTSECKFKREGNLCRSAAHECDLPEFCTGSDESCPPDGFKQSGYLCGDDTGYCFNHSCVTYNGHCQTFWGPGSSVAPTECFDTNNPIHFSNQSDHFCTTLTCQGGNSDLLPWNLDWLTPVTTVVTTNGNQFHCKTLQATDHSPGVYFSGATLSLSRILTGTKCGTNKLCIDGLCTPLKSLHGRVDCPTNNRAIICSGRGTCDDLNKCSCHSNYVGPDCSRLPSSRSTKHQNDVNSNNEANENAKRTLLLDNKRSLTTELFDNFMMLIIMVSLIALFLIIFLVALLCYKIAMKNQQPELVDFYSDSDPSSGTYDLCSPVAAISATHSHHGLRYTSVPTSEHDIFTFAEGSPQSEQTRIESFSPLSVRRPSKDAAVSPFIQRRQSARRLLNQERTEIGCGSIKPNGTPYIDLTYVAPYRAAVSQPNDTVPFRNGGRIRIKDFDQLLQQLDSECEVNSYHREGPVPGRRVSKLSRTETRDVDCQVNFDCNDAGRRTLNDGLPLPMSELSLLPVIVARNREVLFIDEDSDPHVWQPRKSSLTAASVKAVMGSPQRRRQEAEERRKERQGYPHASVDLSSDSDSA